MHKLFCVLQKVFRPTNFFVKKNCVAQFFVSEVHKIFSYYTFFCARDLKAERNPGKIRKKTKKNNVFSPRSGKNGKIWKNTFFF